ncbi:hypothetical protein DSM112329_02861 [Paraconexibacter sp. AEG42_29]|uniref:Uncharacterized protein n=1 Tax=Paraconexibacter sp. AEG42_29 TaxID=2997339 RepID=A0AAU7AX17_9ACTN
MSVTLPSGLRLGDFHAEDDFGERWTNPSAFQVWRLLGACRDNGGYLIVERAGPHPRAFWQIVWLSKTDFLVEVRDSANSNDVQGRTDDLRIALISVLSWLANDPSWQHALDWRPCES